MTVVLKLGGELIETPEKRSAAAAAIAAAVTAHPGTRLIVVHGGGKDIDAALKSAGIEKRQVDGLRITDRATLEIVVGVLAGRVNTHFVAALNAAGVAAVGLTGADARLGLSAPAGPHRATDGRIVDLGLVGEPIAGGDARVLDTLLAGGYVPVAASIGTTIDGGLLNVNADTLAAHVAVAAGADRLIVAGGTAGVLDADGRSIAALDRTDLAALVGDGTATAGMVAKLRACDRAIDGGVAEVLIVDGRGDRALAGAVAGAPSAGTRIRAASAARR